jgi:hypothetical protein
MGNIKRNVKQTRGGTMKTVTIQVDAEAYEFFKELGQKINVEVEDVLGIELYNCYRQKKANQNE